MATSRRLKSVEEHLQEKRRHPSFRELQELDEEKLKVANVIINERVRQKLSQTTLARRLGVTQQQVSKLENGEFDNLATLQKVLSILGYHVRVSAVPLHREAHSHSSSN
ncbi:MAG: helix-turn-helix transcriptional regulator [Candidatus Omnitrophica bacterium]|nr:helix-turn-helix transcriptional regulator [Candidatus Omnitrophota bacterium]